MKKEYLKQYSHLNVVSLESIYLYIYVMFVSTFRSQFMILYGIKGEQHNTLYVFFSGILMLISGSRDKV